MVTARRTLLLGLTISFAALVFPFNTRAAVGSPQACSTSSTCVIGEFLYDDSYIPITTAGICTLNVKYPDGTPYLTDQNMPPSAQSDGWYSYSFTAPATEGYYRAEVCCTPGGEKMCLDKSFQVSDSSGSSSPSDIASAVWTYSSRTISSFGTLVSDIWANATRTLTGASLSSGSLATQGDLSTISTNTTNTATVSASLEGVKKTINESRLLLEQLVNKPVIETSIEETPNLEGKIEETKNVANRVFIDNQYLISKSDLLTLNWDKLGDKEKIDILLDLNNILGDETDKEGVDSLFGQTKWLLREWNWPVAQDILTQAKNAKKNLASAQQKLASGQVGVSAFMEVSGAGIYLTSLEKLLGNSTDKVEAKTIFAKIKEIEAVAQVFDARQKEVDGLLALWRKDKNSVTSIKIDELNRKILALNRVPKGSLVLAASYQDISPEKVLKNKLLSLHALVNANKILLAKGAGASFGSTWLEEGSVVFKTLVTNPSTLISQTVPVKYYLPIEVKKENIISVDTGLEVKYDSEKDQHYVEGSFLLSPGESRTLSVRAQDVWAISEEEVNSLRKQAEELAKPLERTSFFAQGVTLKSDVDVSLDKVLALQEAAITPEERIRAYREAEIEFSAAQEKTEKLKDLVAQAGSAGSLFGFIGGSQAIAVWGLIIIMAAGFVFLAIYMRTISKNSVSSAKAKVSTKAAKPVTGRISFGGLAKMMLPVLLFGASTALVSGLSVKVMMQKKLAQVPANEPQVLSETTEIKEEPAVGGPDTGVSLEEMQAQAEIQEKLVVIGETPTGWLRVREAPGGKEIAKVYPGEKYPQLSENKSWWQIQLSDGTEGWINKEYSTSDF